MNLLMPYKRLFVLSIAAVSKMSSVEIGADTISCYDFCLMENKTTMSGVFLK